MSQVQKRSRVAVVVNAPVQHVWDVIADVTRVGEWSHECRTARWLGGAQAAAPGVRFRGRNRAGWARWSRVCEVVTVDPLREFTWRTVPTPLFPDSTEWCLRLEPHPDGTTITQSFTVLKGPWLLDRIYAMLIPAHRDRDTRLGADLARIGQAASAGLAP